MTKRIVVVVAIALGLAADAAMAAAPPVPEQDPFYAVPGGIGGLADGSVLASREITAYSGPVPMPARAWQVKYKTLDNQGAPTATVTTVMVSTAPLVAEYTDDPGGGLSLTTELTLMMLPPLSPKAFEASRAASSVPSTLMLNSR